MTEIAQQTTLLNPQTGELLPATVENIATVLTACRAVKAHVNSLVEEATQAAVELARERGTQTLHGEGETVTVSGGPGVDYDPIALMEFLEAAGCPEDRINAAVQPTITYKVNRSTLRQLRVNPDYARAIDDSETETETKYRASVKLRRGNE